MNRACDWGDSVPLAILYTALEMRKRGHTPAQIDRIIYQNPCDFLSQCANFKLSATPIDSEYAKPRPASRA